MEKLQKECREYKLYSPDSLKYVTDFMDKALLPKIEQYKFLFGVSDYPQLQINYFDDLEKFRNFIYELRGEKNSLPDYACGTYDRGMINGFIDKNIPIGSSLYLKKIYMPSHELFHIMYLNLILKNDYSKRIVWYDEGMAQFMSGEKDNLEDEELFKEYFLKVKKATKQIPSMNNINHGNSFCNELYNGYDLSYLSIRYLNEILNEDKFKQLLGNFNQIREYGNDIVANMFGYYTKKFDYPKKYNNK